MTMITTTATTIELRFGWWERLCVGRDQLSIPIAAVRQANVADRPLGLTRGARSGLNVSGVIKVGVWGLFGGPRQLVAARRDVPAVHLILDREAAGGDFDEILISDPGARQLVVRLGRTLSVDH